MNQTLPRRAQALVRRVSFALIPLCVAIGCDSSNRRGGERDGSVRTGADARPGVTGAVPADALPRDAAPTPPLGAAICGGTTCLPGTSAVQSSGCCTDAGVCGLRVVISTKCLARKQRGGVDSRCAAFEIPGALSLPGCCSPTGCGALATFDDIGCIPNDALGRATVACTPDVPFR